jgi:hypothetical protein
MCVLAAKYFPGIGWALFKNRDRNYEPVINFRKSNRKDVERLYIWDETTRYSEGINEHGVCIVSASVQGIRDEKEHTKGEDTRDYYSPDGKKIRDALLYPTVARALADLVENRLCGHTLISNRDRCLLLEGAVMPDGKYHYHVTKLNASEAVCRTNHGIMIPEAGYQRCDDPDQTASRISSESRLMIAQRMAQEAQSPMALMDLLTYSKCENPQLNTCRLDSRPSQLKTTGQLMLIPGRKTLYYRPILCDINFDYQKVNHAHSRTYFELVGMRPILIDQDQD